MDTPTINGARVERMTLTVSDRGPWVVDAWMELDPTLTGPVVIQHGTQTLLGTVVEAGQHAARTTAKIVGGGAQWSKVLAAKDYHSDVGVRAALVFADLCRETGERAGTFVPTSERIGLDLARNAVAASTILEAIIGGARWWVAYDGTTNVGPIKSSAPKRYEVLAYEPLNGTVELALDGLDELRVGSTLTERLASPVSVQSYVITIASAGIRALCQTTADVPALMRSIIRHEIDAMAPQPRKYRVHAMLPDGRVELRVATQTIGYPDLSPIRMWPGVSGAHAELATGCEVIVQFVDGNRSQPIITHFAGKGVGGFRPASIAFDSDDVRLGSLSPSDAAAVASYVDARLATIQSKFDTHTHLHGPYSAGSGPTVPTATPLPTIGVQTSVASSVVRIEK